MEYVLLALAILLIAAGQIAQKFAAGRVHDANGFVPAMLALTTSVEFWVAALLLGAGMIAWLLVLSMVEVSTAYPLLSISFVLTALLARLLLGERIDGYRWSGVILIAAGAATMLST